MIVCRIILAVMIFLMWTDYTRSRAMEIGAKLPREASTTQNLTAAVGVLLWLAAAIIGCAATIIVLSGDQT